ncbi:MAG: DUF4276 family protein [Deltaproteobacteria bacterium]|nr:DUF4276 family protein [Deltaproteobacteria bacterium]
MPSLGLIVEGAGDELSYEVFFKRIKPELDIKTLRLNGCNRENLKKIFKILNKKLQQSNYSGVEKGLIICDCDGKCAPEIANFIRTTLKITCKDNNIKIHATCEELETLFLTCIEDVNTINGNPVKFKKIRKPENILNPKEHLLELLNDKKIIYGEKVAEEIASQINISVLEKRSKNFNRLYKIINNLVI